MICNHCLWKWNHESKTCPKCGKATHGSTKSKSNTNKPPKRSKPLRRKSRPNKVGKRKKRQGKDQKQAMIKLAETSPMVCSHCGLNIKYWKWSNIDHVKGKGKHPELVSDIGNLRVLCDDIDVAYSDQTEAGEMGCHDIRHRGTRTLWNAKKNKYRI